jgi:hypothetical protein
MKDTNPNLTAFAQRIGANFDFVYGSGYQSILAFTIERSGLVISATPQYSKQGLTGIVYRASAILGWVGLPILLRRELLRDRIGKGLRINREFAIGDAAFDSAVYIESDEDDDTLRRTLESSEIRDAIRVLVETSKGALLSPHDVSFEVAKGKKLFDPENLERACAALAVLHTLLGHIRDDADPYGRSLRPRRAHPKPSQTRMVVCSSSIACLVIACFALPAPPAETSGPIKIGLTVGAIAWFIMVVVCVILFRGRSTSFRRILILGLCYLILLPFSWIALRAVNSWNDASPPVRRAAEARLVGQSKGGPVLDVRVQSASGEWVVMSPNRSPHTNLFDYNWGPARATTKAGSLGWMWLVSVEPGK